MSKTYYENSYVNIGTYIIMIFFSDIVYLSYFIKNKITELLKILLLFKVVLFKIVLGKISLRFLNTYFGNLEKLFLILLIDDSYAKRPFEANRKSLKC